MTLTEKLQAKKSELAELKTAVEGGDETKAADMAAVMEAIDSINDAIEESERANDMLNSFVNASTSTEPTEEPKSIGDFAVKNLDMEAMKNGAKSVSTGFGFKSILGTNGEHMAPEIISYSQEVAAPSEAPSIRQLLGVEAISGNAITYYVEGTVDGAPSVTAQGATKAQIKYDYTPVTVPLTKIAGWFYETDEIISDAAFLRSAVENRAMRELRKSAEGFISSKILEAIPEANTIAAGDDIAEDIFSAITKIESAGYTPDAIVINPTDYAELRMNKDGNGQYYGGGYFMAPYGNGQYSPYLPIWGLQTIVTPFVDAGSPIVGAFRDGATLVTKAGEGASLEVHRGDHDDAVNNRVTVVVEERLAVAVRVPAAFAVAVRNPIDFEPARS